METALSLANLPKQKYQARRITKRELGVKQQRAVNPPSIAPNLISFLLFTLLATCLLHLNGWTWSVSVGAVNTAVTRLRL